MQHQRNMEPIHVCGYFEAVGVSEPHAFEMRGVMVWICDGAFLWWLFGTRKLPFDSIFNMIGYDRCRNFFLEYMQSFVSRLATK